MSDVFEQRGFPFGDDAEDPPSQDDVLADLLRENFDVLETEPSPMPKSDGIKIHEFLTLMNVKGADAMVVPEIEVVWRELLCDPSLIQDFTLTLMDRKGRLNLSEFPLAITVPDLMHYADAKNMSSLRTNFIGRVAPSLINLGVNEGKAYEWMLTESKGKDLGQRMRFLSWVVDQPFMRGIDKKIAAASKERGQLKVSDLMGIASLEVHDSLVFLKEKVTQNYDSSFDMDLEARHRVFESAVAALEGIDDYCKENLLSGLDE